MAGEEVPPNFVAAEFIAFTSNVTGKRNQFIDQFPVSASTDKVLKFANTQDATNISFRFDNTKFGG